MLGTLALAGLGCALMSNPPKRRKRRVKARRKNPAKRRRSKARRKNPAKRRRTAKRRSKSVSPGSAASRLAHWRWHRNPKPRDLTEETFKRGAATVTIATWRNANATAFIAVSASGPGGVKTWEAKSQGPSSGGYSKPDQAKERLIHKMTGQWPHEVTRETGSGLLKVIADIAAAKVGGAKSNPRRRSKRRAR